MQQQYTDIFAFVLPICTEEVLEDLRNVVGRNAENELYLKQNEEDGIDVEGDKFKNERREYTKVIEMPSSSCLYLTLKVEACAMLSRMIGVVYDCYIGKFSKNMLLQNNEEFLLEKISAEEDGLDNSEEEDLGNAEVENRRKKVDNEDCLLYTSDAADD